MNENDNFLRPQKLDNFFGQDDVIKQLKVFIYSAKKRNSVLDHILLFGPPGLGKTTLANIIANEMGGNIISVSAPSIEKVSDLISLLAQINTGSVLFIDEIHRLKKELSEILYSAMEDFKIFITYKSEENTKAITLNLPPFTLIGATTNQGNLSLPLKERFSINFKFNFYDLSSLIKICKYVSNLFDLQLEYSLLKEIALRSRSTPRILINNIKRLYDYKIYSNIKNFDLESLNDAFLFLKINKYGLNSDDLEVIRIMAERFEFKSVSLEAIASVMNENVNNLRTINEPFLVMNGYINRTKRGRILTSEGIKIYNEFFKNN